MKKEKSSDTLFREVDKLREKMSQAKSLEEVLKLDMKVTQKQRDAMEALIHECRKLL